MAYALKVDNAWLEIAGSFTVGEGEDAIQYPPNWPELATPEELGAAGIASIDESAQVPANAIVVGSAIVGDDLPARQWLIEPLPLDQAKALMWTRAQAAQAAHALAGCVTPIGAVQTNQDSQRLIQSAVSAVLTCNMLQIPFPGVTWTMADNSRVPLNAQQVATMGIAVVTFLDRCKEAGELIRAAIFAADTPDAAFAIDITAGYPAA